MCLRRERVCYHAGSKHDLVKDEDDEDVDEDEDEDKDEDEFNQEGYSSLHSSLQEWKDYEDTYLGDSEANSGRAMRSARRRT